MHYIKNLHLYSFSILYGKSVKIHALLVIDQLVIALLRKRGKT